MVAFPIDNRYGEDHAMDFVWYKGDILIRNFSGVFRYTPGEVEVEMLFAVNNDGSRYGGRPPFFDGLLADGDQLYAYERYRGLLALTDKYGGAARNGRPAERAASPVCAAVPGSPAPKPAGGCGP